MQIPCGTWPSLLQCAEMNQAKVGSEGERAWSEWLHAACTRSFHDKVWTGLKETKAAGQHETPNITTSNVGSRKVRGLSLQADQGRNGKGATFEATVTCTKDFLLVTLISNEATLSTFSSTFHSIQPFLCLSNGSKLHESRPLPFPHPRPCFAHCHRHILVSVLHFLWLCLFSPSWSFLHHTWIRIVINSLSF